MSERFCLECGGKDEYCGNCHGTGRRYRDADGKDVSLSKLCRIEPEWAANRIAVMDNDEIRVLKLALRLACDDLASGGECPYTLSGECEAPGNADLASCRYNGFMEDRAANSSGCYLRGYVAATRKVAP